MEEKLLTKYRCKHAKIFNDLVESGQKIAIHLYDNDRNGKTIPILKAMRKYNGTNLSFKTRVISQPWISVEGNYYNEHKNKYSGGSRPFGFKDKMLKEFAKISEDGTFIIYFEVINRDPWGFKINKTLKIVDRWEICPGG